MVFVVTIAILAYWLAVQLLQEAKATIFGMYMYMAYDTVSVYSVFSREVHTE